jgi:hypothetical protein
VGRTLDHLERDRRCSGVTRNQRLAMIHSLARFVGTHSPAHLAWCSEVRSIPFKKTAKSIARPWLKFLGWWRAPVVE